jgi:hypothetical protein
MSVIKMPSMEYSYRYDKVIPILLQVIDEGLPPIVVVHSLVNVNLFEFIELLVRRKEHEQVKEEKKG